MNSSRPEQPAAGRSTPYGQVRKEFTTHRLTRDEVPVGHTVSLPLPTLRWARPGYAAFAAPSRREPGRPQILGAPDRWWVIDAERHALLTYNLTAVASFTGAPLTGPLTLAPVGRPVASVREELRMFDEVMAQAAPRFLYGEAASRAERDELGELLPLVLRAELLPWYAALTPDFFGWLGIDPSQEVHPDDR
ncbi:hypothetical protein ABT288_28295 [Streptomyces sp. NPDC001093]|uniref:hypothetical protein n=1 Tax=Streptomyces sp. NPDC001093 TaxID=3154376 RepID=UPI003320ABFE